MPLAELAREECDSHAMRDTRARNKMERCEERHDPVGSGRDGSAIEMWGMGSTGESAAVLGCRVWVKGHDPWGSGRRRYPRGRSLMAFSEVRLPKLTARDFFWTPIRVAE
jgi:hypothetical protein